MKKNVPQSPAVVSTGVSTSASECCPQLPGQAAELEELLLGDT